MTAPITALTLDQYVGMDEAAGGQIAGDAHLIQSLQNLLTTPIGSRVMRRTYGSRIPDLVDAPMTPSLVADIVAAAAEAILAWEPRVLLQRVVVIALQAGQFTLNLIVVSNGQVLELEDVI